MKLILHVGPPKTGSSYLQIILRDNEARMAKNGWVYPAVGRPKGLEDHRLLAYQPDDYLVPGGPQYDAMKAVGDAGQNAVFSAEGIVAWTPEQLYALADVTRADEIEVLYFLRNPFQIFYSTWKESIKHGKSHSLPEFFMEHFADPSHSALINPHLVMRKFANLQGPFRFTVQSYDHLRATRVDIMDHLWHGMMGIDQPFAQKRKSVNTSYPIETTEFLRMLLQDYREAYPDDDLMQARLSFNRIYQPATKAISTVTQKVGLLRRPYIEKIMEIFEPLGHLKKSFTVPPETGVHTYIRNQIVSDFGAFMVPRMEQDEAISTTPVAFEYYHSEDLRRDAGITSLIPEMMQAIRDELVVYNKRLAEVR